MSNGCDYSVAALRTFLLRMTGLAFASENRAEATRRTAEVPSHTILVLDYLELPDDLDIRTLDFEAALGRLTMVRPDLAQNTIYGLRSLSRKGVRMFYRWMNGDSEWWHVTKHPARTQRRPARSFPVTVRFALRPEFDARLVVPSDLTAAEAKNLARFIEGLAP